MSRPVGPARPYTVLTAYIAAALATVAANLLAATVDVLRCTFVVRELGAAGIPRTGAAATS